MHSGQWLGCACIRYMYWIEVILSVLLFGALLSRLIENRQKCSAKEQNMKAPVHGSELFHRFELYAIALN